MRSFWSLFFFENIKCVSQNLLGCWIFLIFHRCFGVPIDAKASGRPDASATMSASAGRPASKKPTKKRAPELFRRLLNFNQKLRSCQRRFNILQIVQALVFSLWYRNSHLTSCRERRQLSAMASRTWSLPVRICRRSCSLFVPSFLAHRWTLPYWLIIISKNSIALFF